MTHSHNPSKASFYGSEWCFFLWRIKRMIGKGRQPILTSYKSVTDENVMDIIKRSMKVYKENANDCQFLLDYASGEQPIIRKEPKKVMDWIDCQDVDNVALEISDFWRGFGWGNPITLVLRGDAPEADEKADAIKELNYCYSATGNAEKLQTLADFIVKCGHCYTLVDINTEYEEGESYFTRDVIDPRWAFVVKTTAFPDRRVILGVTVSLIGEDYYMTACSKDARYDIIARKKNTKVVDKDFANNYDWSRAEVFGERNPLGKVNVIEWYWEPAKTGVFENQISETNTLNLMSSDISNGFEQLIQSLWWANNVEFEKQIVENEDGTTTEYIKKPKNGDWIHTKTAREGTNPSIQPLVMDYHIADMSKTYLEKRSLILQKCHVPQRSETSGGSSGVAMDTAAGWADAESVASTREEIVKGCQIAEIKVVLKAIKESPNIPLDNPMLLLNPYDAQPAIRRPKNFDLVSKCNGIATLLSHGFALEDCVANIPLFADATQVIQRSGEGVKRYQESVFDQTNDAEAEPNEDRIGQDISDQVERSPILKGNV